LTGEKNYDKIFIYMKGVVILANLGTTEYLD
jgi:hypothetical protein